MKNRKSLRYLIPACMLAVLGAAPAAFAESSEYSSDPDVVSLVVSPAFPDYAEDVQRVNADPSPNTYKSHINDYRNMDDQLNIAPGDGNVTVLRTDQKILIHKYVTEVIPVKNGNPREIVNGLRVITGKEGGRAEVLLNGANGSKGIQVICPEFQLPYIKAVVAALDKPWVMDFEDGSSAIYYKAKHRDINFIDAVAFDAGTPDQAFKAIDTKNNAVYYHDDEGSIGGYMSIVEKVDVPVHQVLLDVTVYEITEQDDSKIGLDYIAWKNGPGASLFEIVLSGVTSYQWFKNVSSIFDPYAPARIVNTMSGSNKIMTSSNQEYAALNYYISAAFIDFLAVQGKAKVMTSGQVLAKSGTAATFDRVEDIVAFTPSVGEGRTLDYSLQENQTGFFLSIVPHIGLESTEVEISVDMSAINGVTPQGMPMINHRTFSSTAVLMDGKPYVLGGLSLEAGTKTKSGAPILSSIPLLGYAFGGKTETDHSSKVVIVMTPKVMLGEDVSPGAMNSEVAAAAATDIDELSTPKGSLFFGSMID